MISHSPKELAILVVSHRKEIGLSQAEVADRVGLHQKTISAFENRPENIKLSTVFQILSALNLDMRIVPKNKIAKSELQWDQEW